MVDDNKRQQRTMNAGLQLFDKAAKIEGKTQYTSILIRTHCEEYRKHAKT